MPTTIASGAVTFVGITGATVQGIQYYESGSIRVGSTGSASLTDNNKHLDTNTLTLGSSGSSISVTLCGLNIRSTGASDFGTNSLLPDNCSISLIESQIKSATRLIMRGNNDVAIIRSSVLSIPGYALYSAATILENSIFQNMSGGATGGLGIRATFTTPPNGCRIKDSTNGINLLGAFGGTLQGFSFSNLTYEYYIQGAGANVFTADLNADDIVGSWTFFWEASSILTGRIIRRNTYNLRVIDNLNANKSGVAVRITDNTGAVTYSGNTDASGLIPTQKLIRNIYTKSGTTAGTATVNTARSPYSIRRRIYGFNFIDDDGFTFSEAINQESKLAVDVNITEPIKATALAYGGLSFDSSLSLTLSQSRSNAQIYDRVIAELTNNLALAAGNVTYSKIANRLIFNNNLILGVSLAAGGVIAFGGSTLTLTTTATQSRVFEVGGTQVVAVSDGTTDLSAWTFASGAQINLRAGATTATVTIGNGQAANITAGSGVTIETVRPVTVFRGFPITPNDNGIAPNPVMGFYSSPSAAGFISGLDVTSPEYSSADGSYTVVLSDYPDVTHIVGDAVGWDRTNYIPVDSSNPPASFSVAAAFEEILDERDQALVGFGTVEGKAKLTYNQAETRFEVAAMANDFSSMLDKKEDLTSSIVGLQVFETTLLRQLRFISNEYGKKILLPSPLTVAAAPDATTSPVLVDFLVVRAGDATADPYEHGLPSTAPGLDFRPEIRSLSTLFISAVAGGGGPLTTEQSDQLSSIATKANQLTFTVANQVDANALSGGEPGEGGGTLNAALLEFIGRMLTDTAYKRALTEAAAIPSLADELATVRSQLWLSTAWRADWKELIIGVPTVPSTAEIAVWNSYVPDGLAIVFSATGEVA